MVEPRTAGRVVAYGASPEILGVIFDPLVESLQNVVAPELYRYIGTLLHRFTFTVHFAFLGNGY